VGDGQAAPPRIRAGDERDSPAAPLPGADVLAKLGHDLRSPLNGVIGLVRIMLMKLAAGPVDSAQQVRQLELLRASACQMLTTIERVVEIASLDTRPATPAAELVDCRELVAGVVAQLRPGTDRGLRLLADLPDGPVRFTGEPEPLRRLLTELVDNAVKHSDASEVRVRVVPATPGTGAVIEVGDDGSGISPADQRRIFDPFERGESATEDRGHSSGLGLAIAGRIAARYGLHLGLHSTPGLGSTFSIRCTGPDARQ
jgi:signal transduction histidine kinase